MKIQLTCKRLLSKLQFDSSVVRKKELAVALRGGTLILCIRQKFNVTFDRPETRYVRAKINMAGHLDQ